MKKIVMIAAMAAALLAGAGRVSAQRPVGDTIIGAEPTYMYYIYDWWRCANHDPEVPQWYTTTSKFLFWNVYGLSSDVRACYTGPGDNWDLRYDAGNYINGVQMVTERPIKILGIAACGYAQQSRDTTFVELRDQLTGGLLDASFIFPNTRDTTLAGRYTDSLLLLKPTNRNWNEPTYLGGGPWRAENTHRYLPLPIQIDWMYVDTDSIPWELRPTTLYDSAPVVPLYEVMFEKPQVVADSFIVAGTANNNEGSTVLQYMPGNDNWSQWMWLWNKRPTRYYGVSYFYSPDIVGAQADIGYVQGQNIVWYKYRSTPWMRLSPDVWRNIWSGFDGSNTSQINLENSYILNTPIIFPIIDPDFDTTLCDEVRDVRQADATDTTLTLMWDGGNNVEWEVEYFEMNTPTVLSVTTTVPMVTLTGLRERTNYMARVRGRCEWDTEFGEWSGYVDLWTGVHHDGPVSIEGNLGRFTQMMPNPAREQVTVLSSYRLSRVVVYDLGGRAVLEQEDDGLATTLDVSGLAKGVYVVAIHTPAGIATKRLVVEN